MRRPALATIVFSSVIGSCSPSRSTWSSCVIYDAGYDATPLVNADYSTCPANLRCLPFATIGEDGMCHSTAPICATPCLADADCAGLGMNVRCSRSCNVPLVDAGGPVSPGVCTPFQ